MEAVASEGHLFWVSRVQSVFVGNNCGVGCQTSEAIPTVALSSHSLASAITIADQHTEDGDRQRECHKGQRGDLVNAVLARLLVIFIQQHLIAENGEITPRWSRLVH